MESWESPLSVVPGAGGGDDAPGECRASGVPSTGTGGHQHGSNGYEPRKRGQESNRGGCREEQCESRSGRGKLPRGRGGLGLKRVSVGLATGLLGDPREGSFRRVIGGVKRECDFPISKVSRGKELKSTPTFTYRKDTLDRTRGVRPSPAHVKS